MIKRAKCNIIRFFSTDDLFVRKVDYSDWIIFKCSVGLLSIRTESKESAESLRKCTILSPLNIKTLFSVISLQE